MSDSEDEGQDWSSMTVPMLKHALRDRGLKVSGKKAELVDRLETYESEEILDEIDEDTEDGSEAEEAALPPKKKLKLISSEGIDLLNNQGVLIAKILSYIVQDTKDLADLRLVSEEWNANVRPHVLRDFGFRKVCHATKYNYCKGLVGIGERSYAGRCYEPESFDFKFFVSPQDLKKTGVGNQEGDDESNEDTKPAWPNIIGHLWRFFVGKTGVENKEGDDERNEDTKPAWASTEAILFCKDEYYGSKSKCIIEKVEDYDFLRDDASRFANYCQRITETKSFDDFKSLVDNGITEGLFLCLQDLEKAKKDGGTFELHRGHRYDHYPPLILNLRLPIGHGVEIIEIDQSKLAFMKVKIDKEPENEYWIENAFPFVKDYENNALESNESHIYPTFVGYNVKEYEDGEITCQVPLTVYHNDGLSDEMWEWGSTVSFLPLDSLWSQCQEQPVREGVAVADDFVPKGLHDKLMQQIDDLVKNQIVDYHPHSNDIVRDIVHPALYSYVKGVSPLLKSEEEIKALSYDPNIAEADRTELKTSDYWGREYEASAKYQWLPTYFDISMDGSCTICDYINNLVPRSEHEVLYGSLGQLFSQALPLIESVYGYCRVVKENHIRKPEEEMYGYDESPVESIEERPVSLRGKEVQVVTKIVDYELGPGQTYEGVWHVEGMSHEEIVATAIYFIDRDDEIEGGDILFKRAFHEGEAMFIFSNINQTRPRAVEEIIREGLQPLGQVETLPGRLLVFPNSHVHKVSELMNRSTEKDTVKKKRRIIVFFLINPERRIVSTREVPVQQEHAGGTMKRSDALDHRLKLMKERKYTKQDWNVREIELCEH